MDRLVLLLALWEARLGAARPRFPQGNRCRQGVWHRASAGALDASGRLFCVCFVARRRKACRGNWGCRCTGWSAGASALYWASTGIDGALREREGDAVSEELAAAMRRVGELTMENEVLRARVGHAGPLAPGGGRVAAPPPSPGRSGGLWV